MRGGEGEGGGEGGSEGGSEGGGEGGGGGRDLCQNQRELGASRRSVKKYNC